MRQLLGDIVYNPSDLVFCQQNGESTSYQTIYKHFKKIVTAMGRPEVRLHDLRHTYAVLAILAGTDLKTISATLGHHSIEFTMKTYAFVTNTMLNNHADFFG